MKFVQKNWTNWVCRTGDCVTVQFAERLGQTDWAGIDAGKESVGVLGIESHQDGFQQDRFGISALPFDGGQVALRSASLQMARETRGGRKSNNIRWIAASSGGSKSANCWHF